MPVTYKKKVAILTGHCEIEEAEELFVWLKEDPTRQLNLKSFKSAHTAVFQVLLALKPTFSVLPQTPELDWLTKKIQSSGNAVWLE